MRPVAILAPPTWHPYMVRAIRENYPNVAIFETEHAMLREYPIRPLPRAGEEVARPAATKGGRAPSGLLSLLAALGEYQVPSFDVVARKVLVGLLLIPLLVLLALHLLGLPLVVTCAVIVALARRPRSIPGVVVAGIIFFALIHPAMDEITRWSLLEPLPVEWGAWPAALSQLGGHSPLLHLAEANLMTLISAMAAVLFVSETLGVWYQRRKYPAVTMYAQRATGVAVRRSARIGTGVAGSPPPTTYARVEGTGTRMIKGVPTKVVSRENEDLSSKTQPPEGE